MLLLLTALACQPNPMNDDTGVDPVDPDLVLAELQHRPDHFVQVDAAALWLLPAGE